MGCIALGLLLVQSALSRLFVTFWVSGHEGTGLMSRLGLLEGPWDAVMTVIGQAHTMLHEKGILRIQTDIRVGSRCVFKCTGSRRPWKGWGRVDADAEIGRINRRRSKTRSLRWRGCWRRIGRGRGRRRLRRKSADLKLLGPARGRADERRSASKYGEGYAVKGSSCCRI
jgi:Thiamine-binding protein